MLLATTLISSTLFLTFLTILGIGFTYVVLSGLLGAALGDHEASFDHGGEISAEHSHDTVSIFSPKVIAIFMVGFGAAGCIAVANGVGVFGATLSGLGSGIILGTLGVFGLKWLASQRASSHVLTSAAVGRTAIVVVPIQATQAGSLGQVSLTIEGQYLTYTARAESPTTMLLIGTTVKVVAVEGTTLVVA